MDERTLDQNLLHRIRSLAEAMDSEETVDASLSQQLSDIYQSFEIEVSNSKKMDKSALKQQQLDRIQSLMDEGSVNRYFLLSYSLKDDLDHSFFLDLIPNYLGDARTVMQQIAMALESPVVDFDVLNTHCIKLKGSSSCLGACKVVNVCNDFCRAIDKKSKDECLQELNNIKREYDDLQSKLESIIQLEKEIMSAESSK